MCKVNFDVSVFVRWRQLAAMAVSEQFPVGLKVLVVDDDIPCLKILEQMLRKCMYSGLYCFSFLRLLVQVF